MLVQRLVVVVVVVALGLWEVMHQGQRAEQAASRSAARQATLVRLTVDTVVLVVVVRQMALTVGCLFQVVLVAGALTGVGLLGKVVAL